MGLFDKVKKGALGVIDKDARKSLRENLARESDDRKVDRYEKELALKEKNLGERLERRQMLSGEKPLSVKAFAKSKLRERSNNAKIETMNTFTRENVYAGAKTVGRSVGKGLVKAGQNAGRAYEKMESYSPPAERHSRKHKSSYGFDYMTSHPESAYDIQKSMLGMGQKGQKQPRASDITESLLGSRQGKKSRKKKGGYDPFDFSAYYE